MLWRGASCAGVRSPTQVIIPNAEGMHSCESGMLCVTGKATVTKHNASARHQELYCHVLIAMSAEQKCTVILRSSICVR